MKAQWGRVNQDPALERWRKGSSARDRPTLELLPAPGLTGGNRYRRSPPDGPAYDRPGSPSGSGDEPGVVGRIESIESGKKSIHVGVVPDRLAIVVPERVAGAEQFDHVGTMIDGGRRGLFVRHGYVAPAAGPGQSLYERSQVGGGAAQRDIYGMKAEGVKCRVVHGGREGVGDGIAQEREDPRAAVDHRTVPATRLTTPPIKSWSSSKVLR
jgi:hypothetical protein